MDQLKLPWQKCKTCKPFADLIELFDSLRLPDPVWVNPVLVWADETPSHGGVFPEGIGLYFACWLPYTTTLYNTYWVPKPLDHKIVNYVIGKI
jgi:hypothetical protein